MEILRNQAALRHKPEHAQPENSHKADIRNTSLMPP
jgi:hypothetical protein